MFKKIYFAGIFTYLFLFILATIFYKERIAFTDTVFMLFEIIRKGGFVIYHNRFIDIFTEVFPLMAIKASLTLSQVALIDSLSFLIFQFICYLLCGFAFKDYKTGIALLTFTILFNYYVFYWPISEVTQGMALMFPFIAYLRRYAGRNTAVRIIGCVLIMPVLVFAHPFMMIVFAYTLVFLFLQNYLETDRKSYVTIALIFIATVVVKTVFFRVAYESGAMSNAKNIKTLFPHYFNLHSNRVFIKNCLTKYHWITIASLIVTVIYINQKQWKKLALFVVTMIGFILLVNISYPTAGTQQFYLENLYMPIGVFIALPLIFDVLPVLDERRKGLAVAFMVIVFISSLIRIYIAREFPEKRMGWLRNYMNAHRNEKIMADEKLVPMDTVLMTWATPYECWLLSTIERDTTSSIIINSQIDSVRWAVWERKSFVTMWGVFDYDSVDHRYFRLRDTVNHYTFMK